jgi:uncharacterized membrane protein YbhN (UPF0104 family)
VKRLINGLLLAGTIWFVIQYFSRNLDSALAFEGQLQLGWLLLSTLVLLAVYVVQALTWRAILLKTGGELGRVTAVYVFFFGLLASYIPGRVWGPMGMISSASERGVPAYRSVTTTAFATGLNLVAAAVVALLTAVNSSLGNWIWLIIAGLIVALFIFPHAIIRILNLLLEKLGRRPIDLALSRWEMLAVVVVYLGTWLSYGLALYFFAQAIQIVPESVTAVIGANAASYLAGYLAFFTPAGLGVREVVLTEALQQAQALDQLVWLSLLSRIWLVASQLTGLILSSCVIWFHRLSQRKIHSPHETKIESP